MYDTVLIYTVHDIRDVAYIVARVEVVHASNLMYLITLSFCILLYFFTCVNCVYTVYTGYRTRLVYYILYYCGLWIG